MSWGLALSVVLDIGLTVITGAVLIHEAHTSQAIHRSQLEACGIGNGFRAGQRRLWDHVIAVSQAPPGVTPAERLGPPTAHADVSFENSRPLHPCPPPTTLTP